MTPTAVPEIKTPPTIDDVRAARRRLRGIAVETPLLPDHALSKRLGRPVLIKAECLQLTGSFKFRGAFNRIAAMDAVERSRGVVAFSSGNHAQGVAAAASMFGIPSLIVMPADAPVAKVEGTRTLGGRIVFYDRATESREEIASRLAHERGATLIPSFDDPFVIAGQGTAGLEIALAAARLGYGLGAVICPVGGGGLAGGLGLALAAAVPAAQLFGAEPEGFDDARRSLDLGQIVSAERRSGSTQDALLTPCLSPLTFGLLSRFMSSIAVVPDADAEAACLYARRSLKLSAEPGGASALAAVLNGACATSDGALVIVVSGGNAG